MSEEQLSFLDTSSGHDGQKKCIVKDDLDQKQNWKRNDPVTSKMAGLDVIRDGTVGRNQKRFFDLIIKYPGKTGRELESIAGVERGVGSKRLSELERKNLVYRGSPRKCAEGGRISVVWYPKK